MVINIKRTFGLVGCSVLVITLVLVSSARAATSIHVTPITVGTSKIAVLLYDFKDSPAAANGTPIRLFTEQQANTILFNGAVSNFFKEISYGKVTLTGMVQSWERLPRNAVVNNECLYPTTPEIQNSIRTNNIDLSGYDRIIVVAQQGIADNKLDCFETTSLPPHERTLTGIVSAGKTYDIEAIFVPQVVEDAYTIEHELGHSFLMATALGGQHASILDCEPGIVSRNTSKCAFLYEKNHFDFLDEPGFIFALHPNAFFKDTLGWLEPSTIQNITQSGTYQISPIETPPSQSTTGKVAAKITLPGQSTPEYYIEYREPLGADKDLNDRLLPYYDRWDNKRDPRGNLDGIFVYQRYVAPDGTVSYPQLDMSPGYNQDVEDRSGMDRDQVALTQTHSGLHVFYDPQTKITIGPIQSFTHDKISFAVTLNSSAPAPTAPELLIGSDDIIGSGSYTRKGATVSDVNGNLASYSWTVICGTTCPIIVSNERGTLSGYYAVIPEPTISVSSAGSFTLRLTVSDATGLSASATVSETSYVSMTPTITSIYPSSGAAGTGAYTKVSGRYFSPSSVVYVNGQRRNTTFIYGVSGVQLGIYFQKDDLSTARALKITVANSDGGTQSNAVNFVVYEPFRYLLSNDGPKSVGAGESVSSAITASTMSGAPSALDFEAYTLPAGTTASFSSNRCTPSPQCTVTVFFSTSATTPLGTYRVQIGGGTQQTSVVTLAVRDHNNYAGAGTVSGKVTYFGGTGTTALSGVDVTLSNHAGDNRTTQTDASGQYALSAVPAGSWSISYHKSNSADDLNAISALDAALAMQVGVGLRTVAGTQSAACDVNMSGTITAIDASHILQYRVGSIPYLPASNQGVDNWGFDVDSDSFSLDTGETKTINASAYVLGDCNGSWPGR